VSDAIEALSEYKYLLESMGHDAQSTGPYMRCLDAIAALQAMQGGAVPVAEYHQLSALCSRQGMRMMDYETDLEKMFSALTGLTEAAEAFSADQSGAKDPRVGITQPVSVAECNDLNHALLKARDALLSAGKGEAASQPAVPDGALAMSDRNIAGALFDFLGFLTTLEKSVSLGVSELATPAVDLLTEWAKTRGLGLDDADVSGWHSALQHAGQGEARPTASEYLLAADKILSGKKVYTQSGERVTRTQQPAVPEGYVLVPVEPTEAMLRAWFSATRESSEGVGTLGYFRAAYQALLSAAKGVEP
jgi:hypothetical protein